MKALIVGYEILFNGPHVKSDMPDGALSGISSVLDGEGMEVDISRLGHLLDMHLSERARKIIDARVETTLEAVIGKVLEDLEIDEPALIPRLVEEIAGPTMREFTAVPEASDFLDIIRKEKIRLGIVCNSPLGVSPSYIRASLERNLLAGYFEDAQFSSENGMVRPHARPFRFALSNLEVSPSETSVLTGLPSEMEVLNRLGFSSVFVPESIGTAVTGPIVSLGALSEMARYI